ncbi:MAG TPA: hypothetical protein VK149_04305 [Sideroxyarcus sp.]|nr:hypothetical protein [Sideroxyarcus sp.]
MPETSYPFDSGAGANTTEAQYSQLFRRLNFTGISGVPGDQSVQVFADSTGMQVKVRTGYAMVRGHFYKTDSQVTLSITAATSNPRWDLVVLRLDPTTANSIVLAVKTGTAAASPTDPALTQTDEGIFEFPIARVRVGASASTIAAGNVDDLRQFMGEPVGKWTTALRPTTPNLGVIGYNTTLGVAELWNGTAWVPVSPSSILASLISDQHNIVAGKVRTGGVSTGDALTIFRQSTTPTANAVGDLWFW